MTLTEPQQRILNLYRSFGDKFAGHQIYPDGMLKVAIYDQAPTMQKPTPPMLSMFFNKNGEQVCTGYYPRILFPDVNNKLEK